MFRAIILSIILINTFFGVAHFSGLTSSDGPDVSRAATPETASLRPLARPFVLPQPTAAEQWVDGASKETLPKQVSLQPPFSEPSQSADTSLVDPEKAAILTAALLPTTMFVTGDLVNVRSGPGTGNSKVGQIQKGTEAQVLRIEDGWAELVWTGLPAGTAWMSADYLSRKRPAPETVRKAATPAASKKRKIAAPSSSEITAARKEIIRQSIAAYPGPCACPYNRDSAGRKCGKRSAWSKPGGYNPICYDSDVTDARLATHFARQRGATN